MDQFNFQKTNVQSEYGRYGRKTNNIEKEKETRN